MKLVFAIVQSEDADQLCRRLNGRGFRVTRISSRGGFLERANVMVMLGVRDDEVEAVLTIIRASCHRRRSFVNALPWGVEPAHLAVPAPTPLEVEIGGATVFTVRVRRFLRIRGGDLPPAADETFPLKEQAESGGDVTDLVLAVLRSKDADQVSNALLGHGFRLTRIPTAGAWLRRGNVTLLTAVSRSDVPAAIEAIQAHSAPRPEAGNKHSDMPGYSATVFVVPLTDFAHTFGPDVPLAPASAP